ncbi:MAG: organic hydroperoxide resistance protein [Phycisphaerales bacterium]|nr:organic hydroperoxide resistance protein [Phycisphaerales bacterium]
MATLYTAEARVTGGRAGQARSSDGILDVKLGTPKEMGGPGGATNPEQLFAAGYAACFGSAVEYVAKQKQITIGAIEINSRVALNKDESGFGLGVELIAKIAGVDRATAESLIAQAHQVCPYSRSIRNNVDVKLTVA